MPEFWKQLSRLLFVCVRRFCLSDESAKAISHTMLRDFRSPASGLAFTMDAFVIARRGLQSIPIRVVLATRRATQIPAAIVEPISVAVVDLLATLSTGDETVHVRPWTASRAPLQIAAGVQVSARLVDLPLPSAEHGPVGIVALYDVASDDNLHAERYHYSAEVAA